MNNNINGTSLLELTQLTAYTPQQQYTTQQNQMYNQPQQSQPFQHDDEYLKNISKEILNGLNEDSITLSDVSIPETTKPVKINKEVENNKKFFQEFFKTYVNIKEFFILLILYIVLSTAYVKNFFGSYIDCLNTNDDDEVSIGGIIAYGIILSVLFIILKIIFN
jgi:hypothetical protein